MTSILLQQWILHFVFPHPTFFFFTLHLKKKTKKVRIVIFAYINELAVILTEKKMVTKTKTHLSSQIWEKIVKYVEEKKKVPVPPIPLPQKRKKNSHPKVAVPSVLNQVNDKVC